MKWKQFYSPFFISLLLLFLLSCSQSSEDLSLKDKQHIAQIKYNLDKSQSDDIPSEKRLEYINKCIALSKKAGIDSLLLKTSNKRVEIYYTYFPDSALAVLQDFEKLAQLKKDTLYITHSQLNYGDYYYAIKENSTAFSYFNKAKGKFQNLKDSSMVVYSLLMMSEILKKKNDYYDMEAVNTEALNFVNKNNKDNYCSIYLNLGISSKETFDYEKSLNYYKKALEYSEDEFSVASIKNNIAIVYILSGQPQKAVDLLSGLTEQNILQEDEIFRARVLCNLGLAYFKLSNPKALDYLLEALAIREKTNDTYGLISSYASLAEYYQSKNDKPLANEYALKGYRAATAQDIIDERLHALTILSETGTAAECRDYSATYFRLNDSINKVHQKNKNQFAKIRYDFTAQKEQNLKLKAQESERSLKLAKSENQKLIMTFLAITGIAFVFLRFNHIKQKNKKRFLLESYATETRIAKKLHDELANDVYHTMTFAETQDLTSSSNKENLLNNLELIYTRTRNISKENSTIDTGPGYVLKLKEMMASFSSDKINVLIKGADSIPFAAMESNKKIIIYRTLQELLVNMKKHSHCSVAAITFQLAGNKLQIRYSDNGVGIGPDEIFLKNGLQNVENRIQAINGIINFGGKSGKGFNVNCTISI